MLTVDLAASLISRSKVKTGQAVNRLVAAGILEQRDVGRQRYRVFSAPDVLRLFTTVDELLRSQGQQRGGERAPERGRKPVDEHETPVDATVLKF